MRSDVRLTVGPGGRHGLRVHEMTESAPVAWRPTSDGMYMVGTAASPVGCDDVTVAVRVMAGASLTVRSAAASILWSGAGTHLELRVTVEAGAELVWWPEPLIATAGCAHRQTATVDLHPTSRLRWRELLVLGRQRETPGDLESVLRVTVGGAALLHHAVAVGDRHPGWDGPAVLGSAKVLGQLVVAGPGRDATSADAGSLDDRRRPGGSATWGLSPLPGPGALATVSAASVGAAEAALMVAAARLAHLTDDTEANRPPRGAQLANGAGPAAERPAAGPIPSTAT